MNLGGNDLGGRVGEDGVAEGVAVCFDEWANSGDHGVMIYYNTNQIWSDIATCNNRAGCMPVSYFEDAQWHDVEVTIAVHVAGLQAPHGLVQSVGFVRKTESNGCALALIGHLVAIAILARRAVDVYHIIRPIVIAVERGTA